MKINKSYIMIVVALLCIGIALAILNTDNNEAILKEIENMNLISVDRNLTLDDFNKITELTENDAHAQIFLGEARWLIKNGREDHARHPLAFLQKYEATGEKDVCVAHELTHIALYLEKEDIEFAEEHLKVVQENKEKWIASTERKHNRFPQYYKNYDRFLFLITDSVKKLENREYNEKTIETLKEIENYEVC